MAHDRDDERPRRRNRDDDDRPRRRDRDEDRPRRSYRRDDDDTPTRQTSALGVFALIIAIPSLIVAFIPCINMVAIGTGLLAALLGIIGLVTAKGSGGRVGSGLPLTGLIMGVVAAVLAVAMFFVYIAVAQSLPTNPSPSLTTPADVIISAVQLDTEYEQNTIAADAKYKGKIIEVTGVVFRVTDELKKFRLTVELNGSPGSTVDCDFDTSEKASLTALTPGVSTTIRGKCIGRRTIDGDKWVTLEKCVIVPPESKTNMTPAVTGDVVKVKATDFTDEFRQNSATADAKYKGKTVEVTGEVSFVIAEDRLDSEVKLKGVPTFEVEGNFGTGKKAAVGGVKSGTTVTIRGKYKRKFGNAIQMSDCTFVTEEKATGPKPENGVGAVKLTATDLAKAYDGDADAADKLYKGKVLEVSGKVYRNKLYIQPENPAVCLGLKELTLEVECRVSAKVKTELVAINLGNAITFRGKCLGVEDDLIILEDCTVVK